MKARSTMLFVISLLLLISWVGLQSCNPNLTIGKKTSNPLMNLASSMPTFGDAGPESVGLFRGDGPWEPYSRIERHDPIANPDASWVPEQAEILSSGRERVFFPEADCQTVRTAVSGPDVTFRVCTDYNPGSATMFGTDIWDTRRESLGEHYGEVSYKWHDQVWREAVVAQGDGSDGKERGVILSSEVLAQKSYPIPNIEGGKRIVTTVVFRDVPSGEYFVEANGSYYFVTVQ